MGCEWPHWETIECTGVTVEHWCSGTVDKGGIAAGCMSKGALHMRSKDLIWTKMQIGPLAPKVGRKAES